MKTMARRLERLEAASPSDDIEALSDEDLDARIIAVRARLIAQGDADFVWEIDNHFSWRVAAR